MFVFEKNALTAQAARLIAQIAALSGHAGILQLLPGANSQGLIDLGVGPGEELARALAAGEVRGLILFGEEIAGLDLRAVDFLAVHDLTMTEAAKQADVVLPAASFAEIEGSFTAAGGQTGELKPAVACPLAWDNIAQIKALAADAGVAMPYQSIADIRRAMSGPPARGPEKIRLSAAKKDALRRADQPARSELFQLE